MPCKLVLVKQGSGPRNLRGGGGSGSGGSSRTLQKISCSMNAPVTSVETALLYHDNSE
ncbi:hypothetical protein PM082_015231 [Marasmius tenuissimus]|nr:hypothetical protein PM082_015231 [Marasmius tenuissimus]